MERTSVAQSDEAALMTRPTAELSRLGSRCDDSRGRRHRGLGGRLPASRAIAFWQSYLIALHLLDRDHARIARHPHGPAPDRRRLDDGLAAGCSKRATRNLPLMALLFLPIWFNLAKLYPWVSPSPTTKDAGGPASQGRVPELARSSPVRAALYFAIWIGLAYFLNKWSRAAGRERPRSCRARWIAGRA